MDIGGIGFGPDGTDVFMEGLYIPMLKLLDQGKVNETLMAMIRANTRLPIDTEGDVYSLAACNDVGCQRLVEMMDEFGIDDLDELGRAHLRQRSREAVLAEIAKLPQGHLANSMTVDGYDGPVTLEATLTISRQRHPRRLHRHVAAVALRHQRAARLHHGLHRVRARLRGRHAASPTMPARSGRSPCRRPTGCILNAPKPAPVCIRHVIGQMLPDVVFGCLRQVIPGARAGRGHLVPVEHQRARPA